MVLKIVCSMNGVRECVKDGALAVRRCGKPDVIVKAFGKSQHPFKIKTHNKPGIETS